MKTVLMIAVAGTTASASATLIGGTSSNLLTQDQYTVTAQEIGSTNRGLPVETFYSNLDAGPSGYQAFPAATGAIGFDDYTTAGATGGNILINEFSFVGGVTNAGEVMFFEFFDSSSAFVDSFGVQFSQGGNFIWTISLTNAIAVADTGLVQAVVDDGSVAVASTGQWFLTDAAVAIGSSDINVGGAVGFNQAFELAAVPAPASAGLLALGGLAAARRRR